MHKKTYYYVTGNTAEGFVNWLPSNVKNIEQIISIRHPSNPLKTALLQKFITHFEKDHELEIIYSSFGNDFLDGVIVRDWPLAIITDTIATDEIECIEVDLEQYVPLNIGEDTTEEEKQMYQHLNKAYEHFATGLQLHDQLEAIYINEMDFRKADLMTERFIIDLLYQVEPVNKEATIVQRLFGTNTPEGAVNVVPEILDSVSNRYFLKGRAGTGKSTFMRKVKKACEDLGLDLELYHCSFDPNSIDMVLARDLDFCIFDSTDPHEFFPERRGDTVIDLYEDTVTPGTDEKYAEQIQKVTMDYKSFMKKGIEDLKKARSYQYEWEKKYPFSRLDVDQLFERISKY